MNHNRYSIILILLLSFLGSCHNEEEEDLVLNERTLNVSVKYKDKSGIHPDLNAHLYIYYDVYSADIIDYKYTSDGILINNEQILTPDMTLPFNGKDEITVVLTSTRKITILVQSSHFQKRTSADSFSPSKMPIKATFIFENLK